MWGWQTIYTDFQDKVQDTDSSHLTIGKRNINQGIKILEADIGMPRLQKERTYSTLTSTNAYPLPHDFLDLEELYSTVSSQRYYADREYNEAAWKNYMIRPNAVVSDILTNVFVRHATGKFEIYPIASTAGNTMTMIYNAIERDLSVDDYTTGTITTLANGGTAITFSGTTLTAAMVGRWLKTDDGEWYKLSTFTDTTHMTLLHPYQGTAISAGSSTFTIAEMPRLPMGTHHIPIYFACMQHFLTVRRDAEMAKLYKALWDEGRLWVKETFSNLYSSAVIPSQRSKMNRKLRDPNDYPNLSSA